MIIFSMVKVVFYAFNTASFPLSSNTQLATLLFHAIRFDLTAVIYINALFIFLSLFPSVYRPKSFYKRIQKILFLGTNGIALGFELVDIGFYKFAFRRTIGSDLNLFANTSEMIPSFLAEYWYLPILFGVLILGIAFFYKKTERITSAPDHHRTTQWGIFIIGILVFFLGLRGGFQLRPLMPITSLQYVEDIRLAPLVNNTSLNLLFSIQQEFLSPKNYLDNHQQKVRFNTRRQYHQDKSMDKKNVFIIVLESFGQEHVSHYQPELPTTPFLDSLIEKSFRLEHSYANGLRSTQGIVAITSSIPTLMDTPLMFSPYQNNRVDGLAKLLAAQGYQTSFFHGANPGSMEFERYSKLSGFQDYYDRISFNDDQAYDGQWGIWDVPFFQYTAQQVNQYKLPFCALLFSLTSHHPYKTPDSFEKKYPNMEPILRSIRYTDEALRNFFQTAQQMPWYENTLFVITADHIGKSKDLKYQTRNGRYKIPMLIFDPSQTVKGLHPGLTQQVDIMPTLLDLLNYDQAFSAYGESMLDSTRTNHAFHFNSDIYQILDEEYLLLFDEEKSIGLFQHVVDPLLQNNLLHAEPTKQQVLEQQLKAVIQQHHEQMIENTLYLRE